MDKEYFQNLRSNPPGKAKRNPYKAKPEKWKLIHTISKEVVISGAYSLCQWKKQQLGNQFKIVPDAK